MLRRLPIAIAVLAAILVLTPLAGARSTMTIGFEGPLSGAQKANGQDQYRGTLLAIEQINAAGGVAGRKLKLVKSDDKADPALALSAAQRIINQNAFAVIGPYNSSVGKVNLLRYLNSGVIPVQMTSTDDTSGYGVTVQPKNSQISPVEVEWITTRMTLPGKKVAMLVDPSAYTQGMADRLKASLETQGYTVTSTAVPEGKADYAPEVAAALATSPDLVYVSTYYPEGAKIAVALQTAGGSTQCFMGLANQDPAFIAEAGSAAASRCTFSGAPNPTDFKNRKARSYVKAYQQRFKKDPGTWGIFTYDSVNVLAAAVRRAGSWDTRAVFRAIKGTKGLKGATGPITIQASTGNRTNVPIAILKVEDGDFVVQEIVTG